VRDVRAVIRATRPGVKLSAAVYATYPSCARSVGQDWGLWLREDLVDFVCPMDYTADPAALKKLVMNQTGLPKAAGRVIPGLGVTAAESRLDAAQTIEQIRLLRSLGAPGYVIFDLNANTAADILPVLGLGLNTP